MPQWFLGTIQYMQPVDNIGTRQEEFVKQKVVTESYLIDAVSFTDAEARLYEVVAANTPEFTVKGLPRMKLADVLMIEDGGETWYKVKALFIMDDEKSGKQKKTPSVMLVNATTPKEAYERVEVSLKSSLDPFEITDINTTKILEIFPYVKKEERKLTPLADVIDAMKADGVQVSVSTSTGETVPLI